MNEKLKNILRPYVHYIRNIKLRHQLKKKIKIKDKIKIFFICECSSLWDKQSSVVKRLLINDNFDVSLLIIGERKGIDDVFFEKIAVENNIKYVKYYSRILKDLKPHILVYERPYENSLPKDIRPKQAIKIAKLAYIPYGYSLLDIGSINSSTGFVRYLNYYFTDNSYTYNFCIKNHKNNLKYQKILNIGFPSLEDLLINKDKLINEQNQFSKINGNGLKIMWTPRWITDGKIGGSNFFRYIDKLFEYFINSDKYRFVFRPHPYAFSNFVKTGQMTEEQKNNYINTIKNSKNSIYDDDGKYISTLLNSDILITDISSIIPEFMVTGKPIIFCRNEGEESINEITEDFCKNVFYNAHSFEEIKSLVENIKNGIDPLKEKRESYCKTFFEQFIGTKERIENSLLKIKNKGE